MAQDWSTIACEEVAATINETIGLQERRGTVTLKCAWADRYALVDDTVGTSRAWAYENPANPFGLRAFNAPSVNPFAGPIADVVPGAPQVLNYEFAYVTIEYQPMQLPEDPGTAPYTAFAETFTPTMDWIRINPENYRWSTPNPEGEGIQVKGKDAPLSFLGRMEFQRTYYNWVGAFPASYLSKQRTCNSAIITSNILGISFPAETLAYQPGQATQTIRSDGTRSATVTVTFRYQEESWNKFWHGEQQAFVTMHLHDKNNSPTYLGAQYIPFTPVDYSDLLD